MSTRMDNRLVDLEVRYTHLERKVDELSEVVFEQQKTIDRLTKELLAMRSRLFEDEEAADEKPPHY